MALVLAAYTLSTYVDMYTVASSVQKPLPPQGQALDETSLQRSPPHCPSGSAASVATTGPRP
eukprot:10609904-Alexandrium_andersonii.AAC.1